MAPRDRMAAVERDHLPALPCPTFETAPWVSGPRSSLSAVSDSACLEEGAPGLSGDLRKAGVDSVFLVPRTQLHRFEGEGGAR